MSNEIVLPTGQLPTYLQGYQSETNDALITGAMILPRISLRGKQFRFRKDDKERSLPLGVPLRVVIIGATPRKGCSKTWYRDAYSEGSDEAPDCSSADGIKPDNWVLNPVAPHCATCPNNAWGSGKDSNGNPTKGKACSDTKNLLVLPPDKPDEEIWMLKVPPASLKLLSNYGAQLQQHRIPIEGVVTEVTFCDADYQKLEFRYFSFIQDEYALKFMARVQSQEFKDLMDRLSTTTTIDSQQVAPQQAVTPPPPPPPPAQQVAPQQPVQQTEEIPWGGEVVTPPPATAQQAGVQAPDGSYFVSPAGEVFDHDQHAKKSGCVAGAITAQGAFKKRKGTAKRGDAQDTNSTPAPGATNTPSESLFNGSDAAPPPSAQTDSSPAADSELQAILDQWGS